MRDWTAYLRENLHLPAMRGNRDERAIREMADHLEDLHAEAVASGCSEAEAEERVIAWLGDPARAAAEIASGEPAELPSRAERWLEANGSVARRSSLTWTMLADAARDLRTGIRSLARQPLFSAVVVLVLALGIGATAAVYTLVDSIVLSPLPFDESDRLMAIQHSVPARGLNDAGQCAAWHFTYEDENRVFEALGMFTGSRATVTELGPPEAVPTLDVTHGVFEALRVGPVVGRVFSRDDFDPDGAPTVMLGYGYWQSRFGGEPSAVGRQVTVDGLSREIIGVMPRFVAALGYDGAIIRPLRFRRANLFVGNIGYDSVARLRDGVAPAAALADLERMLPMAWEKFPGGPVADSSHPEDHIPVLRSLKEDLVGPTSRQLWVLLAGTVVVLLIACINVANLMLVRAEARQRDIAVRTALGASRRRIVWEHLKESLLLGVVGGVAGLALAQVGLRSLLALASDNLPRVSEVGLSPSVVLLTALLSIGSGLLFGWVPARRRCGREPLGALSKGGRSWMLDRGSRRAQTLLAIGQVALVFVLLVASGLMFRSFRAMARVEPGFGHPDEVLSLRLYLPRQQVDGGPEVAATYEAIVRRLSLLPGVSSVGLATAVPMDGAGNVNPLYVQGRVLDPAVNGITRRHKWIAEGYLETLQIPLLAGRAITWDDVHDRAPVALLSERLARELFGSARAAIGQRVAARPDPPRWKEVVGVVADVREDGMGAEPPALVYWPHVTLGFWQGDAADDVQVWRGASLAVRSDRVASPAFHRAVQQAIWEINPNLPLMNVRTLRAAMADSMSRTSFSMILLAVAACVGLTLGLVGVHGVIAYGVARRTGEIGMRMALGAGTGEVQFMVLRHALIVSLVGVGIGIVLAFVVTRTMKGLLFSLGPTDPLTYMGVAGALVSVALLASYAPARRAATVDPVVALRSE